jgi:hypothetical protein
MLIIRQDALNKRCEMRLVVATKARAPCSSIYLSLILRFPFQP